MKLEDRKLLTAVDMADLIMMNVVKILQDRGDDRWRSMSRLHSEFCAPLQAELASEAETLSVVPKVEDPQIDELRRKLEDTRGELNDLRSDHSRFLKRIKKLLGYENWPEIKGDFLTGVYFLLVKAVIPAEKEPEKVEEPIPDVDFSKLPYGDQHTPGTVLWYMVHKTHCCLEHGCKYGDKDCPVANRKIKQSGACETCGLISEGYFDQVQP